MSNIEIIKELVTACGSLMSELAGEKAANWGLINNALVAAQKATTETEKGEDAPGVLTEIIDKIEGWGHAQCSADLVTAAKRLREGE